MLIDHLHFIQYLYYVHFYFTDQKSAITCDSYKSSSKQRVGFENPRTIYRIVPHRRWVPINSRTDSTVYICINFITSEHGNKINHTWVAFLSRCVVFTFFSRVSLSNGREPNWFFRANAAFARLIGR